MRRCRLELPVILLSVLSMAHPQERYIERIVTSLGVPAASFRATDAVIVAQNVRISGTMKKKKRVVEIAEVTGGEWEEHPDADDIFNDIMVFDATHDKLIATDLLDRGGSELVSKIAHKWGMSIDEASLNIKMRAMIKETIAKVGLTTSQVCGIRHGNESKQRFLPIP